jgi:exopolyphosphatase/guanosine-5'-triphosphate,3'-diphosphate pyrophosphatase
MRLIFDIHYFFWSLYSLTPHTSDLTLCQRVKCAVIDIGTNTLILLIANIKAKKVVEVLYDEPVITRLGQGLEANHFFLPEPTKRTVAQLVEFKKICDKHKVKKIYAVGTAACRIAANTGVFVGQVKKACGFSVEVISSDKEAELSFLSVCRDFEKQKKKFIVVDIGGGSTEIITGPIEKSKGGPETVMSLPIGSVRLTEQFVRTDPISAEQFSRLQLVARNAVSDELDNFYPISFDPAKHIVVATGGTAATLAAVDRKVKKFRMDRIHGKSLKKENLEGHVKLIASKTIKDRQQIVGLEPLRADVILAGAIILNEIIGYFGQKKALISAHGLRYGALYRKFLKC